MKPKFIALQDMRDAGLDVSLFVNDIWFDGRILNGGDHSSRAFKKAKYSKSVTKVTVVTTTTYYIQSNGCVSTVNPKTNRTDQ